MAENKANQKSFYKIKINKNTLIFGFFILLSAILWLMTKLSTESTTYFQFTPKFINSSTGGTYIAQQNPTLRIQIKARGFYILRHQLSKTQILTIDLKDQKLPTADKSTQTIKLPTVILKDKISEILGSDVSVISIEPDTLYLQYSKPYSKKVPVNADISLKFKTEYLQTAPTDYTPDSITVTGQQNTIDSIAFVNTLPVSFHEVDKTIETNLQLAPIYNVNFLTNKVKIRIPVARCTESVVKLPINIINAPYGSKILLLPSQVDVKYTVPLNEFTQIHDENFYAMVDYNDAIHSLSRKLKVKLLHKPTQVISVKIIPEFVEFIQQKH